ncbi:MAG TPA: DUF2252 family protein [Mucilaginibacter sp.]
MATLIERLQTFNAPLLPDMVQRKYDALAENPFRFFRGTCHLFYEDLAAASPLPLSPHAWICGDLHIENFGSYKGDNHLVYFDLNDFDEAVLAPAAWELARMVTSICVAFDTLNIDAEVSRRMMNLYLDSYARTLAEGKARSIEPRTAKGIVCDFLEAAAATGYRHLLKKRTVSKKKTLLLSLEDERHFKLDKDLRRELAAHLQEWVAESSDGPYHYKVKSAVFRLAGTGSLGVKRYLFLLKSTNTKNHYLLLDMKECRPPSLLPYLPVQQLQWKDDAERVTQIQKRMQYAPAALLSTTVFRDTPFLIQELQPVKDTIKFKLLKDEYRNLYQVIDDMGMLTASTQLRSGGMQGSSNIDEFMAFGKDRGWQQAVIDYAFSYCEQVKSDYDEFCKSKELLQNS